MIAWIVALALMLLIALACVRLFLGPTLYDRALAAHAILLLAALALAALGAAMSTPTLVDAAIALIGADLVLAAAILKFFRARSFQPSMLAPRAEGP